jgi:BCCT family betaine/carnitine transporter
MVTGSIFFGSMGCFLFFMVLGNYGLSLQLSGTLDVVGILNAEGATKAIFSILEQLPFSTIVIAVFTLLCLIFTATTFDSISYILASVVQNDVTEEPMRWNRLFWAFALSFLPTVLLFMGGLSTLQTAAIVGGLPLLVIAVMLMMSAVKAATFDLAQQEGYEDKIINIEDFADIDPWSEEGMALAQFEELKEKAQEAADHERQALNDVWKLKRKIRHHALEQTKTLGEGELSKTPMEMVEELAVLTELAVLAKEAKEANSLAAQDARAEFNALYKVKQHTLKIEKEAEVAKAV